MSYTELHGDITKAPVEAIVNAANSGLRHGGGVCGAIFSAAGPVEMQRACDEIGYCPEGHAVITDGFKLPAKKVIHTVGPIYNGGESGEEAALRSAYRSSLELASSNGLKSIAFPLISSGIYGYPYSEALAVAREELSGYAKDHPELDVFLYLFP